VLNYYEIQNPRKRKGIIDFDRLVDLLGFENYDDLKGALYKGVDKEMQTDNSGKENKWTQSIAVGSKTFIEKMKEALGFRATGRKIIYADDTFELREALTSYGKANILDSGNTCLWDQRPPSLISQFLHEI
jgi:putative transposase